MHSKSYREKGPEAVIEDIEELEREPPRKGGHSGRKKAVVKKRCTSIRIRDDQIALFKENGVNRNCIIGNAIDRFLDGDFDIDPNMDSMLGHKLFTIPYYGQRIEVFRKRGSKRSVSHFVRLIIDRHFETLPAKLDKEIALAKAKCEEEWAKLRTRGPFIVG